MAVVLCLPSVALVCILKNGGLKFQECPTSLLVAVYSLFSGVVTFDSVRYSMVGAL